MRPETDVQALACELGRPFGIHGWYGFQPRAQDIVSNLRQQGWRLVRFQPGLRVPEFVGALALIGSTENWREMPEATVVVMVLEALVESGWSIRCNDVDWLPGDES